MTYGRRDPRLSLPRSVARASSAALSPPPLPPRHGISRLPGVEGDKPLRATFKRYPPGSFHPGIAEVHTPEGRLCLLVAIGRTSKLAFVELHEKATRRVAGTFLRARAAAVPHKIHTVLTDNGTHFTEPSGNTWAPEEIGAMRAEGVPFRCHSFAGACADRDIEHRLTNRSIEANGHAAPQEGAGPGAE